MTRQILLLLAACAMLQDHPAPAQDADLQHYVTPVNVPVKALDAAEAFAGLGEREKLYAHWMSEASWRGALICFAQCSEESPAILEVVLRLFAKNPVELKKAASRRGVTDEEMEWLRHYAARFLSNTGNYLSFGDTKFVPRIPLEKLQVVIEAAAVLGPERDDRLLEVFQGVAHAIYSLDPGRRAVGLGDAGQSPYYSEDVTQADIDAVNAFLQGKGLEAWNTRLFREEDGGLVLRIASAEERLGEVHTLDGRSIAIEWGDFAPILRDVVHALKMAANYAANETQRLMIARYVDHFTRGAVPDHKEASRLWVKDVGPAVETYIGFIETYRDPAHVRAEWEGLVSIVNREQSRQFQALVDAAPRFIGRLPWSPEFEKDRFQKPDFTSLEVLAFANGGIPAGINIPNYDEIRMKDGFKNVSLGNVLRATMKPDEKVDFVTEADQALYQKLLDQAFKVQVGLHELLGHGSGKLLSEEKDGAFNFSRETVNPLTGEKVASWYKPGQTWGSQFGRIASSYEECRAEAVGLFLSADPEALAIFGHEGDAASDVTYVNWLQMARAGVAALAYYDPATKAWGQAHMQARFALLRVMLDAKEGLLRLEQTPSGDTEIHLDRSKIATTGLRAVGDFLRRLNVYKATADAARGVELYDALTAVDGPFLTLREEVMRKKKPRHIWVQPVTDLDQTGKVLLRTYPATYQGVIDSFLDRYAALAR